MADRPRISLATLGLGVDVESSPTVDRAREALGGRVESGEGAGSVVLVTMKRGAPARGVVVCAVGDERDVWIGEGRFVRTHPSELAPTDDASLEGVAVDARLFASLREGARVCAIAKDGTRREGVLAEKCRYGALVAVDGKVLAVSFRRIVPLADGVA